MITTSAPPLPHFESDRNNAFKKMNRNNRSLNERDVVALLERYGVTASCLDATTYRRAMRQKAMVTDTNERLEFLGDSVVALIVSDYCHKRYTDQDEAFLSRLRAHLVSGATLARLSVAVGLPSWIVLPPNNEVARARVNVQEDVLEAFIGAVFVELGFDAARTWFVSALEQHIDIVDYIQRLHCSKDRLMQYCRGRWGELPVITVDDAGEYNVFNAKVYMGGELVAEAMGTSRREAETDACLNAWAALTCAEAGKN
jgi:ribonuclease-3